MILVTGATGTVGRELEEPFTWMDWARENAAAFS
jgi:hypothetical protein